MVKGADNGWTEDYLVGATADQGRVRVFALRTTQLVAQAQSRHGTWPTATAALGRALTAAALLGALLKEEQFSVTLRVQGSGPLGALIADADGAGRVRGYLQNPRVDLPLNPAGKLDVGQAVGLPGEIHVTWDVGLRRPYTGTAALVSGEIGEDLTNYFYLSEQTPSVVALGVLVGAGGQTLAAGGVLVQLLPGSESHWIDTLTENSRNLRGISRQIAAGGSPEDLIGLALAGSQWRLGRKRAIGFSCRCSRARSKSLLKALGKEELADMLAQDGQAELSCHFCRQNYVFTAEELEQILADF